MKNYTVTVAPADGDGVTAVMKVEVAGSTPRLTNFSLVAGPNQGVSAANIATIDAELLLTALMPAFSGPPAAAHHASAAGPRPRAGGSGSGTSQRRYMPGDFVETYNNSMTVAAVADHYQVPVHTAQAWVRTARRHGLIAPARSRK